MPPDEVVRDRVGVCNRRIGVSMNTAVSLRRHHCPQFGSRREAFGIARENTVDAQFHLVFLSEALLTVSQGVSAVASLYDIRMK